MVVVTVVKCITTVGNSEAKRVRDHNLTSICRPFAEGMDVSATADLTRHFSLDRSRSLVVFKETSVRILTF